MANKYWEIAVEEALGEAGLTVTPEQLAIIVDYMEAARDMESEACGYHYIENPYKVELENYKRQIERDQKQERLRKIRKDEEIDALIYKKNCIIGDLRARLNDN